MGDHKFRLKLPASMKPEEEIQKQCGSRFVGNMTFNCDGSTKRWKMTHTTCMEPEPLCKPTKYKIAIAGEKLRFSLSGGQGTKVEKCAPLEGKVTFACNNETRRWKVADVGCKAVVVCKAAKYHILLARRTSLVSCCLQQEQPRRLLKSNV